MRHQWGPAMSKRPDWTEDELILALAAYRRIGPGSISKDHPEILALSELLNRLPIHPAQDRVEPFRDPDGVRRRLTYFSQLEAGQQVAGLENYKLVWQRFGSSPAALENAAFQILAKHGVGA